MIKIAKTLWDRLLNEPVFFLGACALVVQNVTLPTWAETVIVVATAIVTRALVEPTRKQA